MISKPAFADLPLVVTREHTRSTRAALAGLALSMLLSSLGTSIANVALPSLAGAFGASFPQVQWIVLAYLLPVTALIVAVGRLGDITGKRRLLAGGIAAFTIASILCGLAPTLPLLIVARALQGGGAAIMMVLTTALVTETVPKEQTGSVMGLLGTTSAIGTALGPSIGGLLIGAFGWRSIFFINAPLGLAALLLVLRHLPLDVKKERGVVDAPGTFILAATLTCYALAMTLGRGHFSATTIGLLVAAFAGIALFTHVEARATSPLIQLQIFRDRARNASLVMSALVATVMMATLVVGPFYLSRALALDAARVGLVMSVGPLVAALTGVPAGRLVDRYGAHRMTIAGLSGIAAGCVLLAVLPATFGIAGYIVPIALITAHYALFQTANNTAVMTVGVQQEQRGVIAGVLNLSRNIGLLTGAALVGALFAKACGSLDVTVAAPVAIATGMRITFAAVAVLVMLSLAIAHVRAK